MNCTELDAQLHRAAAVLSDLANVVYNTPATRDSPQYEKDVDFVLDRAFVGVTCAKARQFLLRLRTERLAPETTIVKYLRNFVLHDYSPLMREAPAGPDASGSSYQRSIDPQSCQSRAKRSPVLELDGQDLAAILRRAVLSSPATLQPLLLTCKRFRDELVRVATQVTLTHDAPALLRHCRALRSMTLRDCRRVPWNARPGGAPRMSPSSLAHLTTITCVDLSGCCALGDSEIGKLACLPRLRSLALCCSESVMRPLARLTALAALSMLCYSSFEVETFALLTALTALRRLAVSGGPKPDVCVPHMTALTSLTSLTFSTGGCLSADWEIVAACAVELRRLQEFELMVRDERIGPTDGALAALTALSALTTLTVNRGVTDAGLSHVSALRALRSLDVGGARVSSLAPAAHLPALRHLALVCTGPLMAAGLAHLSAMTALETLDLRHLEVRDSAGDRVTVSDYLEHVQALVGLTRLNFSPFGITDQGLGHLTALQRLADLHLDAGDLTEQGFRHVAHLTALTALTVDPAGSLSLDTVLHDHLGTLRALRSLSWMEVDPDHLHKLTDAGMAIVYGYSALTELRIQGCDIELTDGPLGLAKLPDLQILELADVQLQHSWTWPNLARLRKLKLSNFGHAGSFTAPGLFDEIIKFRALESLVLDACTWHAVQDVSKLRSLPHLTSLTLDECCQMVDVYLPQVARLSALRHLGLRNCSEIYDAGVACLTALTNLTFLDLRGTSASEDGLAPVLRGVSTLQHVRTEDVDYDSD